MSDMAVSAQALAQAVAAYRALHETYGQIAQQLDDPQATLLQELAVRVTALLEQIRCHDDQLAQETATVADQAAPPLEQERRQLARLIQQQNELLFPRIHGMMALLHADLQQIRQGMAGVSGYHQSRNGNGARLNTSC